MNSTTKTLIRIYGTVNEDWLGYKLTKQNHITYHHIKPKREGYKATIENGAIIGRIDHNYIHLIERCDKELYGYITELLTTLNRERRLISDREIKELYDRLEEFERKHKNDRTRSGDKVIKEEYKSLRRVLKK